MSGPGDARPAELVLASRSPQRRAILELLGVRFVVRPADVVERTTGDPRDVALENALRKAQAVAGAGPEPGSRVLGVDTIVVLGGAIYGKPPDAEAARTTLRALSGATHTVISGLALLGAGPGPGTTAAVTGVRFRRLDEATIDWYLAGGEWRERAGGYAIQGRGAALVEAIDGDYTNVVGLPLAALLGLWPDLLVPPA
ncbi:MAG: nucleoside triphosphate pyrophosphatase [Solirubrobacteraceae bacterium]|nr:nucleoside triphosphate pyrophosphatase [Solirubrobacteraceae bacterium]